ncbi:MAG: TonB-dependent receptor plug domain-containing protein [Saprospiraceae bacterium]
MIKKIYSILLIISLSFSFLQAQNNDCDGMIRIAKEGFQIGDFNKVIESLEPCFNGSNTFSNNSYREEAYVLLASTYIAKDSLSRARQLVSQLINLNPSFQTRNEDLLTFKILVEEAQRGDLQAKVSSVSKVAENLYEAPASVVLVTEEEIKRRGYLDLEALLHDLPGFDISRSNGILYSTIYPRGYRSNNTNRMLLLVDGVEENDLWGNIVYLSRQYPISNIKNVEVIYGPASTIYGANAFTGVISINTKNPSEYIDKDKVIGVSAEAGYGAWNTRYVDATVAADFPNNKASITITARLYQSDEQDFSNEYWNDFGERSLSDPSPLVSDPTMEGLYQYRMGISDNSSANTFYQTYGNHSNSAYFNLGIDANGDSSINLSNAGLNRVLDLENKLWSETDYSDKTNAGTFSAKIKIGNLKIGWQYWYKEEGVGTWFNDIRQAGTNEGQYWSPYSNFLYARYDTRLSSETTFTSFTRYKVHGYLESNVLVGLKGYSNGSLGLTDLLEETDTYWSPYPLTTRSNQMRHENRMVYAPNENFSLVSGFELRYSAIQDNYATTSNGSSNAQDHFFSGDGGIYSQIRYQKNELTFTGGFRIDYNKLLDTVGYANSSTGYGIQFNPRLAIVYHPGQYVFKAIYATAFKDATNFDRYSTVSGQRDLANPSLTPERVFNYEVSARRFLDKQRRSSIEVLGYFADYTSVIATKSVLYNNSTTTQFQNSGLREVYGVQIWANYNYNNTPIGDFHFYGNYTFTQPNDIADKDDILRDAYGNPLVFNNDTLTKARVGDIAKHQFNFGVNYQPNKNWNINLRGNYVGERQTGEGTTVTGNLDKFPAYIVLNGAVSYRLPKQGLTIQAVANNILNTRYYSPGLRDADNFRFSSSLPQNRLNLHLRVRWNLSFISVPN